MRARSPAPASRATYTSTLSPLGGGQQLYGGDGVHACAAAIPGGLVRAAARAIRSTSVVSGRSRARGERVLTGASTEAQRVDARGRSAFLAVTTVTGRPRWLTR